MLCRASGTTVVDLFRFEASSGTLASSSRWRLFLHDGVLAGPLSFLEPVATLRQQCRHLLRGTPERTFTTPFLRYDVHCFLHRTFRNKIDFADSEGLDRIPNQAS